jgi:ferrous iron transport protein A
MAKYTELADLNPAAEWQKDQTQERAVFRNGKRGRKGAPLAKGNGEAFCGCANESRKCDKANFSLSGVGRGCCCRVRRHHAQGAVRQRLMDMGLIPNAEVEVMRVAPLGDPMEIKVASSLVTLRKHEADQIEIIDC